jgi:hypothetical protein
MNSVARSPLLRVNRQRPCPICGKPDNCNLSEDGKIAYCRRIRGDRQGRDGGWTHFLTNDFFVQRPSQRLSTPVPISTVERASDERCADVYLAMIREHLVLSEQHRTNLRERELPSGIVMANGYVSAPPQLFATNVARALHERFNLEGVPGFYKSAGHWRIVDVGSGFYIPVRSSDGLIQGFQVRRDDGEPKYIWLSSANRDGGASSKAPVHFANHLLLGEAQEIVITEGALKADCIAHLTQAPVIGVAGVSTFGADFAARLRNSAPRVRRVLIAYDRDLLEKQQVYGALMRLTKLLEKQSFQVRIRTWPPPEKGYDDYLLSQLRRQEVAA